MKKHNNPFNIIVSASVSVAAILFTAGLVRAGECTHRIASKMAGPSCIGSTNGTECVVIKYNNLANGAQSETGNPWETYGDACIDLPGSWMNCVAKGGAALYIKTSSGVCEDGQCSVTQEGDWVYYGTKTYYESVDC